MDHLALEVGRVDDVVVDDPERADPGGGEIERGRRAEAPGADQQHLRVEQLDLALDPDLGQKRVARVAVALLGGQPARVDDRQPLLLPGEDPARDRGDVLVAELLQLLGRLEGAVAAAAVEDRPGRLVGRGLGDLVAEQAGRDQLAALEVGLLRTRAARGYRSGRRRRPRSPAAASNGAISSICCFVCALVVIS